MLASLVVRSIEIPTAQAENLIAHLPERDSLSWVREGEGLIAGGIAAHLESSGADRFATASRWWHQVVDHAEVTDSVALPGTGLVCFGSFGFADAPGDSVVVIPQWVLGRRGQTAWFTTITVVGEKPAQLPTAAAIGDRPAFETLGSTVADADWVDAVAAATTRIQAGELDKVVLARDLIVEAQADFDLRSALEYLAASYPTCWTFAVAGLFGATPELLVRRERGVVTSRVLAGTIRRTGDAAVDAASAAELAASAKDLEEHEYAVRSVVDALAPHCSSLDVPAAPFVLELPNVLHLATDVRAIASDGTSSLALAAALHPSAAVGGTPRADAVALIAQIEGMDRGRYAAPVGWMDAAGDGEWGIALRSAQVSGAQVRLFAGCGVVGSSDPASELAESQAKMVPVRSALGLS